MADYAEELHRLSARTKIHKSENYQIARFVDSLKKQLDLQPTSTLPTAISMAYKAEVKVENRSKSSCSKKHVWERPFYQRKNMEGGKQFQVGSSSKTKEEQTKG